MSNQEMPDFFNDESSNENMRKLEKCEKHFDSQLTSRGLTWQRFNHNPDTNKYLIVFGTKEGIYIEAQGDSIKECFEQAIIEYDRVMTDKQVPLDPIRHDKIGALKPESTDLIENPQNMYKKIKDQLINDHSTVSKDDAQFFLDYFKNNIDEDDYEIATEAQKILSK